MIPQGNLEAILKSDLPHQLADEHWEFLAKWFEMMFKDGFIHGYKHGIEEKSPCLKLGKWENRKQRFY